ncbi:MAG: peptide ABC transporter substrate-binding protein [Clostridiales bacterium]|nr:peptide ABC transporter substrate-binding protein [Clostridiales bacterium]
MKKVLCLILAVCMLAGCGTGSGAPTDAATSEPVASASENASTPANDETTPETSDASDDIYTILYASEYTTLNYLVTGNTYENRVAANTVDGLIEYDTYGVVTPCLAESWTSNADNTVWTFKIREGVKWVDYTGAPVADVTANDWVSAAQYVNEAKNESTTQYMYDGFVKNAGAYYNQTAQILEAETAVIDGTVESVEAYYAANEIDSSAFISFDEVGVKALDDYTLEYTMESSVPFFLSLLSYASYLPVYGPFMEEQGEFFGIDNETLLYCGAYIFSHYEPNVTHEFIANPEYWDKENIFITAYTHIYNADEVTLSPSMFQRGEVDFATIGPDILDTWLADDATKDIVHGSMPVISYSYFYAFNFEPRFDAQYEPDNWIKAVNNENFRQALRSSLDRVKAFAVQDPYNAEQFINNTITPATFAVGAGLDFTQYEPLKEISDGDSFDEAKAIEFRDKAKEELTAAGATFPIKALMPYNPVTSSWDKECQIVEQQIEALLGSDFIDIIPEAGPSSGFLGAVRRTGAYAFMKCNWGADYADPQTYTDPFADGNSYNFMYTSETKVMDEMPATNKTQETQDIVTEYYRLVDLAKGEIEDNAKRFEAFATAETYLIDHAIVIPFSVDTDGYRASRLDPFSSQYAPYGLPPYKYKGVKLLDKSMSIDEYNAAYDAWKISWAAAQAAVSQ